MLLRGLRWIIGLNSNRNSSSSSSNHPKRLPHAAAKLLSLPPPSPLADKQPNQPMLEAVHEIAIFIHRFHNLDLFQQGWYQIKITMRREDGDDTCLGTPARVVQYEAPDLGSDDVYGVWRINDTDHSFFTPPFKIKYARQDVLLSVMISFNLSLGQYEGPSTSAVILKFELMYAPVLENGFGLQSSLDVCSASVHEFRIPPKALLGLHSYCPVHFDTFHAVLVDITVHITLLKGGVHSVPPKVPSDSSAVKDVVDENYDKSKQVMLVRALLTARGILLEELQKLSNAINQAIDLTDFTSGLDDSRFGSLQGGVKTTHAEHSTEASGKSRMDSEKPNGFVDFQSSEFFHSLSRDELLNYFHSLGSQILYLWNTFLKFHRENKIKILEYLRDVWAVDRRAEWSIWMVYSKVDMPHQYITSGVDGSYHGIRGKVSVLRKLTDDVIDQPAQTAAMRAELHRRSIEQMRINNRSIQDLHIFGDPSGIPIIIVERVVNAPLRSTSGNSYFTHLNQKDTSSLSTDIGFKGKNKLSAASPQQNGRVLRIVVFVHGFQGHHLDLRLVRNQWLLIDPKVECLMSEVNEDKTSGDFREMGVRLAQEVAYFIKKKMDKASRSGNLRNIKLSFVGHSIGNVIIRTALTESIMEPYLRYLYTYLSVSGPHLGYLYSSNSLFNSGLWLLKKLRGTQCIHQLTYTDNPDLQNTFFYKLSKQKTLENFKNIVLLSSPQDGYIPYHSARIELCQAASGDNSRKGKVFLEMLNDCLDQIRTPSCEHRLFMRCDVNFDTSSRGRNLNTFIGRAAHIEFLESDVFARFIMWSFPELFQ
ncbi:protein FAM135B-like isoform X3 [Camellia sinensis]|uniref:protein FAM135B-like isoform X3 n=2 Tax=Camellia sinensis TaxID=4442 RepID=UPI001036A7D2|nr:protein FAM135B-like isoform X3 [Camellia sinensis]